MHPKSVKGGTAGADAVVRQGSMLRNIKKSIAHTLLDKFPTQQDDMLGFDAEAQVPYTTGRRYILAEPSNESYAHARTKARQDAEAIAVEAGYQPIAMCTPISAYGNLLKQAAMLTSCALDWARLSHRLRKGDMLLVQYPHFPFKSAPIARFFIRRMQRRGCRFVALVHDLDSWRGLNGSAARYSDQRLLPVFDSVICHNVIMQRMLVKQGFAENVLIPLGLFDYLSSAPLRERTLDKSIGIAGNLAPEKCGYLYQLIKQRDAGYTLHLYGSGFAGNNSDMQICYHGVCTPDEIPAQIEGAFGLVWDGIRTDTCAGSYGEYTRLNNPHKASLYLAAGMPVLIWKEAALAGTVVDEDAGIVIADLDALGEVLSDVSAERYAEMAANARRLGYGLREGARLKAALRQAECINARKELK